MKKISILTFISALWFTASAQVLEIKGGLGLDFGSTKSSAKLMMKSKHPDVRFDEEKPNVIYYVGGQWIGKTAGIWAFQYTDSNELHTICVFTEPENESGIYDLYESVVKDLSTKYGDPTDVIETWKYPYEQKDKYTHGTTALRTGKATMMTYWQSINPKSNGDVNNTILVEITTTLDVKVTYQDGLRIKEVTKKRTAEKQNEM
jgi:hypothetical protein